MRTKHLLSIPVVLLVLVSLVYGQVDSQWRGPNRDGVYPEKNLLKSWPTAGPTLLWEATGLGQGHSSVAVTADKVFVTGMLDKTGYLFAYNTSGKLLWKKAYGAEWTGDYPGARTTPAIVGKNLYIISAYGVVSCFDITTGNLVWSVDAVKTNNGKVIQWGIAESPLIDGNRVFVTTGGSNAGLVALDRMTGKLIWKSTNYSEPSAYCSPVIVTHNNIHLLLTMTQKSIVCLNADNGEFYWSFPHVTDWDINPNTPYYKNGNIFCASGYGTGSVMLKLAANGKSVTEVWRNKTLDPKTGAFVVVGGYIYGSGDKKRHWQALKWEDGVSQYQSRELGNGNVIYADGMLYCYSEKGEMALVKADPTSFKVVSVFPITKGTDQHWAHTVIRDGKLYVRHGDTLLVYSIAAPVK
ncbi:MAG TPA: PQQ-binding-like beta-propeller repeat protein [bacterium]|nr:PQQ-binding-like beta-propeller repeat protein [bacterium]HPN43279.1 PQQ-binding-like beta-propeller repeat protein [bacterium]